MTYKHIYKLWTVACTLHFETITLAKQISIQCRRFYNHGIYTGIQFIYKSYFFVIIEYVFSYVKSMKEKCGNWLNSLQFEGLS